MLLKYGEKKAKIALAAIKNVYDKLPETEEFIDKAYSKDRCNKIFSLKRFFFSFGNNC